MLTRIRKYSLYFDGPTASFVVVQERRVDSHHDFTLPKREYGLGSKKSSARRLIKALACSPLDTTIHLGLDGWSATVYDKPMWFLCLSNSTNLNRRSSTTDKTDDTEI